MLGSQPFQKLLDRLGEALVRGYLGHPPGVATGGGDGKDCEDSDSGRLVLVRDV